MPIVATAVRLGERAKAAKPPPPPARAGAPSVVSTTTVPASSGKRILSDSESADENMFLRERLLQMYVFLLAVVNRKLGPITHVCQRCDHVVLNHARFPGVQPGLGRPEKHMRGKEPKAGAKKKATKGPDSKAARRVVTEEYNSQNQLADFVDSRLKSSTLH